MTLTRRAFVAGLSASAVPWQRALAAPPRVIVVGAGLAGLAAAYELQQAGAKVELLEQSDRVGGRVMTVRDQFDDGAWVDVGGQTTGAFYANFFYYATKFELPFEEQQSFRQRADYRLHLRGQLLSGAELRANPDDWPLDLLPVERALAPFRLLNHYLAPIVEQIGTVENVLHPDFADYDQINLRQLLDKRGASAAAIELIDHTLNYNSVDTVSALSVLRDAVRARHMQGGQALNLDNGNEALPQAFAERLADRIHYRHVLRAVRQTENAVELTVDHEGTLRRMQADCIVMAIPFTALRKIEVTPALPASRQTIINELPYTQIVQTWLQTRTRFWEQGNPMSMLVSDGPLERLFDNSRRMQGERGMLINWVNGTGVSAVRADGAAQQLANVVRELDKVWPDASSQVETALAHDWGHTYVEGAYAHYAPGQMTRYAADIPQPIGRLHFAGEHTELVAPGMEGALTSGKRAAAEILARLN